MVQKVVEVMTHMTDGWKVTANVRGHELVIDQPGVDEAGANPLETFLFSLGGCISSIARMVAREQKIDLKKCDVKIQGILDTAGLLGQKTAEPIGFKQINLTISVDVDLSADKKKSFIDLVCHRCPIHDNLINVALVNHSLK